MTSSPSAAPVPANATAQAERDALCDLLLETGPDAATLCSGWTTRDLAAHLVIRENRPDAALGIVLPPVAPWTGRVQSDTAQQDFASLVQAVRQGPPRWSPQALAPVDGATNTIEFFVHHEDVRRAQDGWEPRELDAAASDQLWSRLRDGSRWLLRRSPVGVMATPTDGPDAGREVRLRGGEPVVRLVGPVGEIVLACYGRLTRGLEVRGGGPEVTAFLSFPR